MNEQMRECFEQSYGEPWDSVSEHIRSVWEAAWDASRAVLVIGLPSIFDHKYELGSYGQGYDIDLYRKDLRAAVEAAGLQVKP